MQIPVYDFVTHSRSVVRTLTPLTHSLISSPTHCPLSGVCVRKEEAVTVYPADVVLFEGILMFYSQEIRDLFQMKLFVDTDADTRLSRRGVFADSTSLCISG